MITELSGDQIKRFNSWIEAKEFLLSVGGGFVFRGVHNAEWDLETSLDRCAIYRHAEAEKLLIESFERSVPNILTSLPEDADRVSWMALMRHYGLPSRLLRLHREYSSGGLLRQWRGTEVRLRDLGV